MLQALAILSAGLFAATSFAADLIVINANVLTVDKSKPYAQAFAVENGRFTAVGTNAEIRHLATASTKVIDLKGKTVTPGFNDAHLHPGPRFPDESPYSTPWLGPDKVKNMDQLVAVLKKKADATPKGKLVAGDRYDDEKLGRHPNRHDLDQASTEHPISISQASGHVIAVNSYLLKASGITKDTQDPPGGAFDRDPDGTPNGVIREAARRLLTRGSEVRIPDDQRAMGLLRCFREYAERGITSVGIAGGGFENFKQYEAIRAAGNPVRIGFMFSDSNFSQLQAQGHKYGEGDDRLRVTSIKAFHGNSLSGRTCWLSEPYSDRPDYFGIPPARSQEQLDQMFQQIHDAGWQIATHSNGDREIDMVLTAIERAQAKDPRPDARHRIEHASVMNQSLLERAKKAGVILVFHSYMWEHGDKLASYGEKRLAMMHPHRTAMDMGIHLAGHSDSTVSAADPLLRIQDMVTRKGSNGKEYGANQRVGVEEALEVWTLGGAYATFEEKIKGSITPGKLADFVVLRADPRKVAPDAIKDIVVDSTWIGGQSAFMAPSNATAKSRRPPPLGFFGDGDEDDNVVRDIPNGHDILIHDHE
jgi:predicted amidohydrolase YtcJ